MAILAPCVYRGRPVDGTDEAERPELARILRGFTVVFVFDVSSTEGPPLPDIAPTTLQGDVPAELWDRLAARIAGEGFALARGDCSPANGRTDFGARTVVVHQDLAPAQATKTLAHELAHVLLHDGTEYATGGRHRAEVEAESVAFLVCASAGLPTQDYSFPYVASWAAGDVDVVKATAETAIGCARGILRAAGLLDETGVAA